MSHPRPTPYVELRDAYRYLNIDKLCDVGYINLGKTVHTASRDDVAKFYKMPKKDKISIVGKMRLMEEKDVKEVLRLYNLKNKDMKCYIEFSKKEIAWFMLPKDGITYTYVVEDPKKSTTLTDFVNIGIFRQKCLNKEKVGHNWDHVYDGIIQYFNFTKNDYKEMMK